MDFGLCFEVAEVVILSNYVLKETLWYEVYDVIISFYVLSLFHMIELVMVEKCTLSYDAFLLTFVFRSCLVFKMTFVYHRF